MLDDRVLHGLKEQIQKTLNNFDETTRRRIALPLLALFMVRREENFWQMALDHIKKTGDNLKALPRRFQLPPEEKYLFFELGKAAIAFPYVPEEKCHDFEDLLLALIPRRKNSLEDYVRENLGVTTTPTWFVRGGCLLPVLGGMILALSLDKDSIESFKFVAVVTEEDFKNTLNRFYEARGYFPQGPQDINASIPICAYGDGNVSESVHVSSVSSSLLVYVLVS